MERDPFKRAVVRRGRCSGSMFAWPECRGFGKRMAVLNLTDGVNWGGRAYNKKLITRGLHYRALIVGNFHMATLTLNLPYLNPKDPQAPLKEPCNSLYRALMYGNF